MVFKPGKFKAYLYFHKKTLNTESKLSNIRWCAVRIFKGADSDSGKFNLKVRKEEDEAI